jgi:hypothetical protein
VETVVGNPLMKISVLLRRGWYPIEERGKGYVGKEKDKRRIKSFNPLIVGPHVLGWIYVIYFWQSVGRGETKYHY